MSLLVVNSRAHGISQRRRSGLGQSVSDLIQRARFAELPIAHLHQGEVGGVLAMMVPIGRYDPVFASPDLARAFPAALVEFLVHSPSKTISVAGVISRDQLMTLTSVLGNSGFVAKTHASVLEILDGAPVG